MTPPAEDESAPSDSSANLPDLPETKPSVRSVRARLLRATRWLLLVHAVVLLLVCAVMWAIGDRVWPGTVLLFAPRWVWAIPLALIAPLVCWLNWRLLWVVAAMAVVCVVPIMGWRFPPLGSIEPSSADQVLRIVTFNVGAGRADRPRLAEYLSQLDADVLVCQEWRGKEPLKLEGELGAHVRVTGRILVASRLPIGEEVTLPPRKMGSDGAVTRYAIEAPAGVVHVAAVHLTTPREGLERLLSGEPSPAQRIQAQIKRRAYESAVASQFLAEANGPLLVAGDFNMPVESRIYRRSWAHWQNAFSESGGGFGWTKFTLLHGIRIDHVLASDDWRPLRCWVGPDLGSDHRPVIADLELIGGAP